MDATTAAILFPLSLVAALAVAYRFLGDRTAAASPPDLVVLDLGLPDMDGVEVIHGLRGWTTTPILVLSGRSGSADKVEALDAGADDYVTKPSGVDELLARIRAATRRAAPAGMPALQIGQHTVDFAARLVSAADGTHVRLTPMEWHLLEILARNSGRLVSQRHLLTEVWGPRTAMRPTTCGSTWPSCAASWNPTPRGRST
jgi:two-component system KDP operon response regulator KdpE